MGAVSVKPESLTDHWDFLKELDESVDHLDAATLRLFNLKPIKSRAFFKLVREVALLRSQVVMVLASQLTR